MDTGEEDTVSYVATDDLIEAFKVIKRKKDEDVLIDALKVLLNEGKGQAGIKNEIGAQVGNDLVRLSASRNKEVSIAASKVLRSITVHKNNKKRFKKFCSTLLINLKNATPKARVPLTAVIWNLSSIASNREELIKANALPLLISALEEDGEIQSEAAGALRNFTLDEDLFPELAETQLIDNMMNILESLHPTDNNKMMWNILDSFENLSCYSPNHKVLARKSSIIILSEILQQSNVVAFQKFVLTIFYNISSSEEIKEKLTKNGVATLLIESLETLQEESLISACQEVLLHIQEDNSDLRKKIRKAKLKNPVIQSYAAEVQNMLRETAGCDVIKEKNITFISELGEGSFGAVYLAEYQGFPVAVKFLKYELSEKGVNKVLEELKVMRKLKHPNIVLLMGATVDSHNRIMILTEYASRGDLKNCLDDIDSIAKRMKIARDLARGLCWCHHHHVTHRDLKLENIFITDNWGVKIGDFGLSIQDKEGGGWHNFRGNVKYSAPELLRERALRDQGPRTFPYGVKTDVYSFGLLWYEILTRLSPFKDKPEEYKGREGQAKYTLEGHRPVPPQDWPKELRRIMQLCWHEEPNERPTFEEILQQWDTLTIKFLCPKDKAAKTLIKDLWKDQSKKPSFSEFKEAFVKHCLTDKMSRKDEMLLEEICRENIINPSVTFEQFCHIVGWYGPLNVETSCSEFFERIRELKARSFFRNTEPDRDSDNALLAAWQNNDSQEESTERNEEEPVESNSKRYFILKYSLGFMGKFELRYIDEHGEIHYSLVKNVDGILRIGADVSIGNWSKLSTIFKRVYDLHPPK